MEPFCLSQVQKLFTKFSTKPMARILERFSEENPDTLSLKEIDGKLKSNSYASPFDFAIDVRELIINAQEKYAGNTKAILVLEDLSYYFEIKIGSLPLTKEKADLHTLDKCLAKYTKVRRAFGMSAFAPSTVKRTPAKTAVSKSVHGPPAPLVQEIQRMLNEVNDVETLAEICRILKTHIPNFELKETITIDAKNLSGKCIEDLRRVLTKSKATNE